MINNINETIDVKFFIEDEATISRALIKFDNVGYFDTTTITNFSGSSGGSYPRLILKEKINPFADFWIKEIIMNYDWYKSFLEQYNRIVFNKIKGGGRNE